MDALSQDLPEKTKMGPNKIYNLLGQAANSKANVNSSAVSVYDDNGDVLDSSPTKQRPVSKKPHNHSVKHAFSATMTHPSKVLVIEDDGSPELPAVPKQLTRLKSMNNADVTVELVYSRHSGQLEY